jgi:hypothetical protein
MAIGIYFITTSRHRTAPTTPALETPVAVANTLGNDATTTTANAPQITGAWDSRVMRGKDPVSGTLQIGLSGRFVVTGADGNAQESLTGDMTVDVYDLKPSDNSIEPRLLEEWLIESANFSAFGQREKEGFVLNLKLPWSTYRPDLTSVKLTVKFKLANGPELTHEVTVTLDHSDVQTAFPDGSK